MLLKKVERPRELKWYQAGAMLYGDWGTSKAYVLGIAFALAGHASWLFLGLMGILTVVVGCCYITICRMHPDGGGVYSSVRSRSKTLAVIGALLLVADYVVTASLSSIEAFHYFHFPHPEKWAIFSIFVIGAINWLGPGKAGNIAAIIAVAASVCAAGLFFSTLPHLPHTDLRWPEASFGENWSVFVGVILALSGVEAIANMTSIMVEPVEKTSQKAIIPVMLEVTILTFLLGIAMNSIPGLQPGEHTEDMLRALGNHFIGPWFGHLISIIFGFLLLSAANTAIGDLVSTQFIMAKDRELPQIFTKLNQFGMPIVPLMAAIAVPSLVLIVEHDVVGLAALYAIGVVGAITLNIGASGTDPHAQLSKPKRAIFIIVAAILAFIWITIAYQKSGALIFALGIIAVGLLLRFVAKKVVPAPALEIEPGVNLLTLAEAKELSPLYPSSSLVALKSLNMNLLNEAALRAKALGESAVYLGYVEEAPITGDIPLEMEPSEESVRVLVGAQKELEKRGITAVPIWQLGVDAGRTIARAARELDVDTVIIGTTKRSALTNLLRGEVLRNLTHNLPKKCHLVISG